jgi:hypothetical protein
MNLKLLRAGAAVVASLGLAGALLLPAVVTAQDAKPAFSTEQLDQMLAPIALYRTRCSRRC